MQVRDRVRVWLGNRENLLLLALILVHLIPLWAFKYFPSQDGPTHIENASVILNYFHPDRTIFREYYLLNKNVEPTWLGHLFLAGLMFIIPTFAVEKVFLSGYVILLPLSIRYALRAIRPDSGFLVLLMFPFIYNYPLHMGFYSFSYSLPVFFLSMGYWARHGDRFTARKTVALTFLFLLLYSWHLVSLVMAYVGIVILTLSLICFDVTHDPLAEQFDFRVLWKLFRKRFAPLILAFLPTILLIAIFLFRHGLESPETGIRRSFHWLFKDLVQIESLVSFGRKESFCSAGLGVLFGAVFLYVLVSKITHRRINRWDGLLAVGLGYILIYLFAPNAMSGGFFITDRLNLYPFFALVLWFGVQSYVRSVRGGIMLVAIAITLASLWFHALRYAELNDYLAEYFSGMHLIRPNTTLLPLVFDSRGHAPDGRILSLKVRPFLHASGYIAAERHVVEFTNYEAGAFNYFPTIFRSDLNPYTHIGIKDRSIIWEPPQVDFLTYTRRTGGRVDYVLVWGIQDRQRDLEAAKSIAEQIKKGYNLILSSKTGLMQLYERKS